MGLGGLSYGLQRFGLLVFTHRPLSSSFLGLPCRILNKNHKKELFSGPMGRHDFFVTPKKLETGVRTIDAGIPYIRLERMEAIGFSNFWASAV